MSAALRCTDVVRQFVATGFDVTCAGEHCALHCYSPSGTTVVVVPLVDFLAKARGPRDANGRAFPRGAQKLTYAAPALPAVARPRAVIDTGARHARCAQVFACLKSDLTLAAADACAAAGVTPEAFSAWVNREHRGELKRLRRAAGLAFKPVRRPQNLATAAARGEPLRKPGGAL